MKQTLRLAVLAIVTTIIGGCQSDAETTPKVIHQQHTVAAETFSEAANELSASVNRVCRNYSNAALIDAQQAWQRAMQHWMFFQGREKGSENALALSWDIQFWPDKKNTTGRKLTQLLEQDVQWTATLLSEQSVAVQGLGAAEWFLFEHSELLKQPKGCELAIAVGQRITQNAIQLEAAWQSNPWQQLTPQLALVEYLGALSNQLDYSMKKLTRPLGKPGFPKPYQAESWRSGTSLANLKFSVEAMQQLYIAEGKGLDALLRSKEHFSTADRIALRFQTLLDSWPTEPSMGEMLTTREGYRSLLKISNSLEYIQIALQDDVAPELGIVVGFNATDGD
ncbi:imelysin family protein [Photobacterium minamisatsumaniensis]|uniref:imelysin family protein n=1 Tax=Photobacterium minamisatsumaniensis TaxID=2910233 RepID=UPI003D118387